LSPNTAPGSSAGLAEQETSQSGYDLSPETSQSGYDLSPNTAPGSSAGLAEQYQAPVPNPASFDLPTDAMPFSSPTPQGNLYDDIDLSLPEPEYGVPGPGAGGAEQYEAPEQAPRWEVNPETVPSWEEAPGSNPAPSWEEQPAETNWKPTMGAAEPDRPAPGPPIAPAAIPHTTNGGCPTIIVFGAKGGVGKTTTSIHLAQRAGRLCPDMRITLIDANRGQGDIRTKLRTLNVPTIFDALPEEGRGAIITPPALDKDRPPHLEPLAFALIAAPPSELSDPTQVTPEVYQNALSEAREVSDLVIVDTQISEKYDTTKLFENFLIPLLIKDENIWGVGATEDSPESINNLLERLHQYRARGVKAAKIFTLIAQAHAHNTPEDLRDFEEMFDQASTFAGAVPYNKTIYNRLSSGILCEGLPPVAEPLDRILYAVTGKNAFITRKEPEAKKKKRRFGKSKTRKTRRR
ncbi:ParA family protein, partial [uncultured Varibaculum sp.]|uniref:ParA family protein n=1 Tax=uncultured Varibaculum sp. TaxID=413896 RepID=UPI00288BED86